MWRRVSPVAAVRLGSVMSERRQKRRLKSFLRGFVYFDKRRGAMSCLIRDLNEEGARIIFSEGITIPDVVSLHVPQKEQTLKARVSWRRGDEIGLAFSAEAGEAPDTNELLDRVAQLEGEIAKLRRMLKRLKAEKPTMDDEAAA
jgi:hypothetical protein